MATEEIAVSQQSGTAVSPVVEADEAAFEECLAAFQNDVTTVTRCFYVMAAINHLALQDASLLKKLNEAPDFWNLVQAANQTTLFITLGRIFDQGSDVRFNLDRLVVAAQKDGGAIFAPDRLGDRKRRSSANANEWLGNYLKGIYVPTPNDFRVLRQVRERYRQSFNATYRPIRRDVYAHGIASKAEAVELFAETRLVELQRIIRFLQRLGDGLWGLYWNGHNPMSRRRFSYMHIGQIADGPRREGGTSDQEIIVEAARQVMDQLRRT
jgi:AbiU2